VPVERGMRFVIVFNRLSRETDNSSDFVDCEDIVPALKAKHFRILSATHYITYKTPKLFCFYSVIPVVNTVKHKSVDILYYLSLRRPGAGICVVLVLGLYCF
jgi:hypothetical protein